MPINVIIKITITFGIMALGITARFVTYSSPGNSLENLEIAPSSLIKRSKDICHLNPRLMLRVSNQKEKSIAISTISKKERTDYRAVRAMCWEQMDIPIPIRSLCWHDTVNPCNISILQISCYWIALHWLLPRKMGEQRVCVCGLLVDVRWERKPISERI